MSEMTVGWIGLGRMGTSMAGRLVSAGYDVSVWNRTRSKAEPLQRRGATVVDHIMDLADRDVVFTMVSTPAVLESVMLDEGGLLTGERVPRVIVDSSTVDAGTSERLREAAAAKGVAFIAAPVSGNDKVAAKGQLSIVASGPRDAFDSTRELLEAIGRSVTYVGEGERARLVKIAHNLFLGIVTQAMAEVTVLAEKGGISRTDFLTFLNDSVMGSVFTRYKTPAFVNLDLTPTFTPVLLQKDFDLGLGAARSMQVPVPVTALVGQIIAGAVAEGRVEEDFAVLLPLAARAAGLELAPDGTDVSDGLS
ncbi:NAD(P)-dependent oxidoreductase [Streptomyces sp. NPDC002476]|uniref:NAD(P)-dependent oxidoreductase n=1 Tax=Streptomyces sp. NPDC002476 TaxID=3364648 RepID=UPI0036B92545